MSDCDPIAFRLRAAAERLDYVTAHTGSAPAGAAGAPNAEPSAQQPRQIAFNRLELNDILAVYGRKVAAGEWRDYAMEFSVDKAVFAVYRRASEFPLYRIEKNPKLARKQGAFSVIAAGGLILKRGPDLKRVLGVLEKTVKLVDR